ncbi:hypothetical protein OV203_01225 [Nannocystis sp. ILAH1]|uniref:hypothetical protein n=1 Tax=Nannocystis sp. ILAH1 TaxID=2996789 RepID=UPI00226ED7F6|nr:hypothetical protein [Nannocystis sp. ILAH1]MCY0985731.1 hypothetical protein [Nannocystis sp. ILAH1]
MSIQHDRMNVEHTDNQDERQDIWRRVYAHVFSAAFMQRLSEPSFLDEKPLDEIAQDAADLAIANIPTTRTRSI